MFDDLTASGRFVLVVEDDEATRLLLKAILNELGMPVVGTATAAGALRIMAIKGAPALMLLDWQLGKENGEAVVRKMPSRCSGWQRLPVVLVSAWPAPDLVALIERLNIAGFVSKPFDVDELLAMARHVLSGGQALVAGARSSASFTIC